MLGPNDHWEQYNYYDQPFSGERTHDPPLVNTNYTSTKSSMSELGQFNPKGYISKPVRRRSRVSKSTPIILLNTDVANFRFLVQKFTGCLNVGARKGPINLNFSTASQVRSDPCATIMGSNGYKGNFQPPQIEMQQEQENHKGENMFPFETQIMPSDGYFSSGNGPNPNQQAFDDQFLLEHGSCLNELIEDI